MANFQCVLSHIVPHFMRQYIKALTRVKSDYVSQVSGCVSDALKFHKYATNRRAW